MLTFQFTDVIGFMSESDELTSGMVGKKVQILVDESWQNLSRTYVFRAGGVCRTADGSDPIAVIPEEVLAQPFQKLYVGVYCTDAAGKLVIPTMMAEGPLIRYGADPTENPAGVDLPVWKVLQNQIGNLQELETRDKTSLVAAINELSGASSSEGLSPSAALLLISILRHAVYETDQSGEINALATLLGTSIPGEVAPSLPSEPETPEDPDDPEITLSHISASYSGGSVPAGTALTALTGITVTAHYSDGTSETVTGYTLSGAIIEGSNLITITYGGMTTTFSVTGTAESGEEPEEPEITLTHISAAYSGGSVPVGTSLSALTGITVTAHYSDGSVEAVTDYTLSGVIIEGSNLITVTYGGMTTTFSVTGTAASGEDPTEPSPLYSWDYTKSLTDTVAGQEMRILGATQDADGLHIVNETDRAFTGVNVQGKTVEIEFGAITDATGTRAIMLGAADDINSATYSNGLCWHGSCWAWYQSGWNDKNNTNILAFANSTMVIPFKADGGEATITVNGEVFMTRTTTKYAAYLGFGSNKTSFRNMTIKKLKIYEGA